MANVPGYSTAMPAETLVSMTVNDTAAGWDAATPVGVLAPYDLLPVFEGPIYSSLSAGTVTPPTPPIVGARANPILIRGIP